MWQYRSAAIFIAALAFALKTAIHSDPVSLVAMIVFLACHYCDRYASASRAEVKITAKFKAYEDELENIKNSVSRIGLTMGIRGNK